MAKLTEHELEEQYNEVLDGAFGTVTIAGMEYDTSRAVRELDFTAYSVGFNDWVDGLDDCEDCDLNPIECTCVVGLDHYSCAQCGGIFTLPNGSYSVDSVVHGSFICSDCTVA